MPGIQIAKVCNNSACLEKPFRVGVPKVFLLKEYDVFFGLCNHFCLVSVFIFDFFLCILSLIIAIKKYVEGSLCDLELLGFPEKKTKGRPRQEI